uniref:Ubiquitin-like domain-containing protein n=1 Tax=Caenorhabditis tropicalis TaxID=1561998 RepID=A0A1I7U8H9_9PELO
MELFFELQDDQNVLHDKFSFEFDSQKTLNELRDKITSKWKIRREDQKLSIKDEQELYGRGVKTIESFGLKDGDTVIVKHANLPNWKEMTAYVEEAVQAKLVDNMGRIISSVEAALPHLKLLTSADFFTSYPRFGPKLRSFKSDFAHYLDSDDKHIEFALQEYFSKIHGDSAENPTVVVNCEEKARGGIQGGVIANVSSEGNVLGRFYVKVHIGLAVYPYNQNADLREIFAYKLLELIKLGPKVHFVPNIHYSLLGLYISTEEVIGFRQADEVEMSDDQMSERELIRRILVLKDLHSANYGVDSNGKLSIIDFKVGDNYGKAEKYWAGENKEERQRVARQCLESWQLETMIIAANDSIIQQKHLFRRNGILYKPSRDFSNYLAEIRKNITYISNSL